MLPSPTAAATRLTGPKRTSPQAKMPGVLGDRRGSLDAATELAKGCPVFAAGGSVEVYETFEVM